MCSVHVSFGSCLLLVVAGITYGIIMAIKDLSNHATPVIPCHGNCSNVTANETDFFNEPESRILEKIILSNTTNNFSNEFPVNNVNVLGNLVLNLGDFLMLNVSCNGTPPFEYCSEILKDNITIEEFSCSQVTVFTLCHMEIKKFLTDGRYKIGIYIGNDVREVKKLMEVIVYNVDTKPTLSTVIIPVVCSLLTLIIIAIGISFYIQQRNQLAVEVANFDFVDKSDSYTGKKSFFKNTLDFFTCRNCRQSEWSCVRSRSESEPLLRDESLPYI